MDLENIGAGSLPLDAGKLYHLSPLLEVVGYEITLAHFSKSSAMNLLN
jgi:hypothetical protein